MSKKFQKKVEDFVCEKCGKEVKGNGFTNHCPVCLWSKHVDVNPGDREETCGGMMKPVRAEIVKDRYVLIQVCDKCGVERRNKLSDEDNFDEAMRLTKIDALKRVEFSWS